jgi:hypothetical protein
MEMLQGNILFVIKQTKNVFCFSNTENRKAKQVLSGGLVEVGGDIRKECRGMNVVEICTHVYKCKKNETC